MSQSKINEYVGVKNGFSSLKRKRQYEEYLESTEEFSTDAKTCFTNSAFSSTPKRVVARRRTPLTITNNFIQNPCLEVKSIADIINTAVEKEEISEVQTGKQPQNPYEVVRKPPKKKKRETEIIEACFENPALNLELPEKLFNPYEVCRECPAKQTNVIQSNCFVNAALNLRAKDATISRNLYEIQRCDNAQPANVIVGVENPGLEEAAVLPTDLKIALPFKPTVGCRIDFSNLPIEQITPSKLLADKLVFSPVLVVPKRSMDSASEESSMDIGKELDRYQLELENSINEAKIRKTAGACVESKTTELRLQVDLEQRVTFTQKLAEIVEEDVADMVAEALYEKGVKSRFVHKYMGRLEFSLDKDVQKYNNRIFHDVISGINDCPRSLFIFDEVDKMPQGVFDSLTSLVDYNGLPNKMDGSKAIFIFISNTAGVQISDQLAKMLKSGFMRENIKLSAFEQILEKASYNLEGGLKKAGLIEQHVIDHYIPFLPLEKHHVHKCIEAEFDKWDRKPQQKVILSMLQDVITYEREHGLFATSGCKTIEKKVATEVWIN